MIEYLKLNIKYINIQFNLSALAVKVLHFLSISSFCEYRSKICSHFHVLVKRATLPELPTDNQGLRDKASCDTEMIDSFTLIVELNFSSGRFYFTCIPKVKCVSMITYLYLRYCHKFNTFLRDTHSCFSYFCFEVR